MESIIRTVDLTKSYNGIKAINKINLEVMKGQIYGFLGRNGAGKTTTIRVLTGLVSADSGEVEVFGYSLKKNKNKIMSRVGSLIDYPGFYNNLTGIENLIIQCKLRGIKEKDAIDNALEVMNITDISHRKVKGYSTGMRQRLGLARAILHKPELLILDEPTNGLDPVGISEIRYYLKSIVQLYGTTIFISSHILKEIELIADRIGIIHSGQLLEQFSLKELLDKKKEYLELKVSDESRAVFILENKLGIKEYEVLKEKSIRIYENIRNSGKINRFLIEGGVEVEQLIKKNRNLEDYFLKITKEN